MSGDSRRPAVRWRACACLCVLAAFIALSGCSALQLGYNNADTLLHWRAGQYFGFEGEQKARFDQRVQRFLAWHRKTELPRYVKVADELAARLAAASRMAISFGGYDSFQSHLRQSLRSGSGEIADLLDALTASRSRSSRIASKRRTAISQRSTVWAMHRRRGAPNA